MPACTLRTLSGRSRSKRGSATRVSPRRSASIAVVTSWPPAVSFAWRRRSGARIDRLSLRERELIKIAPSILNADFGHLADAIQRAEAGGADWIHVDVMDGLFVPNLTLGPMIVEAIRRATSLPLDVHLMIDDPRRYIR